MYKVFLFNKALVFASPKEVEALGDPPDHVYFSDHADLLQRYRKLVHEGDDKKALYIVADDPYKVWELFASGFRNVSAAGGVVKDPKGRVLFIYRHNRWDLPKGKVEEGEDPADAAVREVEEECGVRVDRNEGHLMDSYHIYQDKGVEYLKKTAWYSMQLLGAQEPYPQKEEGISKVEWKASEDWEEVRRSTFASILDVLDVAASPQFQ